MTDTFILDATIDFIKANRGHVDLAFSVEEAVVELRARAIETVLEGVASRVGERFTAPWTVRVQRKNNRASTVCVLDESWALREMGGWEGVRPVANGGTGWNHANISLGPLENADIAPLRAWLRRHDNTIGTPLLRSGEWLYWALPDDLQDWNGAAFACLVPPLEVLASG